MKTRLLKEYSEEEKFTDKDDRRKRRSTNDYLDVIHKYQGDTQLWTSNTINTNTISNVSGIPVTPNEAHKEVANGWYSNLFYKVFEEEGVHKAIIKDENGNRVSKVKSHSNLDDTIALVKIRIDSILE